MVSGGGGAYLISGNAGGAAVSVEEATTAANMTHATRVSQATVSHNDSPFVSYSFYMEMTVLHVYHIVKMLLYSFNTLTFLLIGIHST